MATVELAGSLAGETRQPLVLGLQRFHFLDKKYALGSKFIQLRSHFVRKREHRHCTRVAGVNALLQGLEGQGEVIDGVFNPTHDR